MRVYCDHTDCAFNKPRLKEPSYGKKTRHFATCGKNGTIHVSVDKKCLDSKEK